MQGLIIAWTVSSTFTSTKVLSLAMQSTYTCAYTHAHHAVHLCAPYAPTTYLEVRFFTFLVSLKSPRSRLVSNLSWHSFLQKAGRGGGEGGEYHAEQKSQAMPVQHKTTCKVPCTGARTVSAYQQKTAMQMTSSRQTNAETPRIPHRM